MLVQARCSDDSNRTCGPDQRTRAAGLLFMYVCVPLLCAGNRSKESCNRPTTESFRANCGYLQFTRFTAATALLLVVAAAAAAAVVIVVQNFRNLVFYIFANFKCIRPSLTVLAPTPCVDARAGQHDSAKGPSSPSSSGHKQKANEATITRMKRTQTQKEVICN